MDRRRRQARYAGCGSGQGRLAGRACADARLRDYFGDELLTQVGRNMMLTPLVENLADPVRNILWQIQATVETRVAFDPIESRRHFRLVSEALFADSYSCVVWTGNTLVQEVISHEQYLSLGHVATLRGERQLPGMPGGAAASVPSSTSLSSRDNCSRR